MHNAKILIIRIFRIIGVSVLFIAILYSVTKYSIKNGLFDDFDIHISGNEFVNTQRITNQIYPHLSSSLLSVSLKNIQREIISFDYIETAQISSVLPNTLLIQVVERTPALLINLNDETFFIDKKGTFLPANNEAIRTFPVPVLSANDNGESLKISTTDIAYFIQFLLDEYSVFYENLNEVKIHAETWTFHYDQNTWIYAQSSDLYTQFNILKNFENTIYPIRQIHDYSYIDLRTKDQVIVKEKYRKG